MRSVATTILMAAMLSGCARTGDRIPSSVAPRRPEATTAPSAGTLDVLTYNVAGLPPGISASSPTRNIPLIGPLLNAYDVVLVQEDFVFFRELAGAVAHPYRSEPADPAATRGLGDGLDHFSIMPLRALARHPWSVCSGVLSRQSDCLTGKGFSVAELVLGDDVTLDVYNVHFDAGDDPLDVEARAAQAAQLADTIEARSPDRPILVGGDTNMAPQEAALSLLLERSGLLDACASLECPGRDMIDRVLYRSASALAIEPTSWTVDDRFRDERGVPLSDHPAIAVAFRWTSRAR